MTKFTIFAALLISGGLIKVVYASSNLSNLVLDYQKNLKSGDHIESYFKTLATLGILQGAVNVENRMQQNTLRKLVDIKDQYQKNNFNGVAKRFKKLTETMQRDNKAIEILQKTLKVSMSLEKLQNYRIGLKKEEKKKFFVLADLNDFKKIEEKVLGQLRATHSKLNATVHEVINKMESSKTSHTESSTPPTITSSVASAHNAVITEHDKIHFPPVYVHMPVWSSLYQVDNEGFIRFRRQNKEGSGAKSDDKTENQIDTKESSEFDDDFPAQSIGGAMGGGGIPGLIASLSGGEGGSDVGALIGAVSGVVTTLFGPGGLDVPSLISSGTSLIAGLLSGDDNFGKVLATYLGLALEGFTGGGGADLNGEFLGQFVGTFLGQLSADPEEESGPKPSIFFDNFHKGFEQTKQKRGTEDHVTSGHSKSYFLEFISNIISSLVGGVTNLILNSSVGSSGGSSQASADLSSGSSQGSHSGSASASQTSSSSHQKPPALKVNKM